MNSLRDAWDWYRATRSGIGCVRRLGERHWDDTSLAGTSIFLDERFKEVEATDLVRQADDALRPLDDLAILVLFSVFEANVRDYLAAELAPHVAATAHPVLRRAAEDALQSVREGSFALSVLAPLQAAGRVPAALTEKVAQVRRYRNWVSHGRPDSRRATVVNLTPAEAHGRLAEFLEAIGATVTPVAEPPPEVAGLGGRPPE